MSIPAAISDYRKLAQKRLPKMLFDFIDIGAFNGNTSKKNHEDFSRVLLRKRVLQNVSEIDIGTKIFGQTLKTPIILAPVGYAGLFARRGEIQAAKAAQKAGIPFCLSTMGICSIEDVHKSTEAPFWFQLYMFKDRGFCLELLRRANEAKCPVLIVTVDTPVIGVRYQDVRNGMVRGIAKEPSFAKLAQLWDYCSHPRWAFDVAMSRRPLPLGNIHPTAHWKETRQFVRTQIDQNVTWKDIEWLRANWPGKLVVKGILNSEDAHHAVEAGSDGIVVSNHAGRHLDSIPSTISMLGEIAQAVGSSTDILFDGGIGSGLDVIKALALGAKATMVGRSWAYALAARGELGVSEMLAMLNHELKIGMAQLGVASIAEIDSRILSK